MEFFFIFIIIFSLIFFIILAIIIKTFCQACTDPNQSYGITNNTNNEWNRDDTGFSNDQASNFDSINLHSALAATSNSYFLSDSIGQVNISDTSSPIVDSGCVISDSGGIFSGICDVGGFSDGGVSCDAGGCDAGGGSCD